MTKDEQKAADEAGIERFMKLVDLYAGARVCKENGLLDKKTANNVLPKSRDKIKKALRNILKHERSRKDAPPAGGESWPPSYQT